MTGTATRAVTGAAGFGRVHVVGVGGAHMSGIARILLARGATVSGSDAHESPLLDALRELGAEVYVGHAAEHVDGADTVVASSAVRPDNPELAAARAGGLRVLSRADAVAELMAGYRQVAVSGTHGKTTTTAMLTAALQACGADPSYAIGADLDVPGSGAHQGAGELFVVEADESDGAFLRYAPYVAVVTNVGLDHTDRYATLAATEEAFREFAGRVTPDGSLISCADDPGSGRLAEAARDEGRSVLTYGEAGTADWRLADLRLSAAGTVGRVLADGRDAGRLELRVPGRHNAHDALAALVAGVRLGFDYAGLARGLAAFGGARRRMECRGAEAGVRVYDDYAHNPVKVAAALSAARLLAGEGRLVVVFQPHLYSRTAAFAPEFGTALAAADAVVVMDVYAAREDPVPGVTGELVARAVPDGKAVYAPDHATAVDRLAALARPGDLVLTVGAGDVTTIGPRLLDRLAGGSS